MDEKKSSWEEDNYIFPGEEELIILDAEDID